MSRIYIGNLSYNLTEEEVSNLFSKHGNVVSCEIMRERESGRSRGFAFIEFSAPEEAHAAKAEDGTELNGRNIKVNEAKERSRGAPRSSRGDYGGGFNQRGGYSQPYGGGYGQNQGYGGNQGGHPGYGGPSGYGQQQPYGYGQAQPSYGGSGYDTYGQNSGAPESGYGNQNPSSGGYPNYGAPKQSSAQNSGNPSGNWAQQPSGGFGQPSGADAYSQQQQPSSGAYGQQQPSYGGFGQQPSGGNRGGYGGFNN